MKNSAIEIINELNEVESIDSAINLADKHLPEGYIILIEIENHGYNVSLKSVHRGSSDYVSTSDGMKSDIVEAVKIANNLE